MKKNILYIVLIALSLGTVAFVVIKYNKQSEVETNLEYATLPRKSGDTNSPEWIFVKTNIDKLLARVRRNPSDNKARIALANAYITESRVSGNNTYYDKAALASVDKVLEKEESNFEALTLRSLLLLSQHHFAEGLATAEKAQKINPENAFVYGLLVDGNVEMGKYPAALDAADKMISIRPDIRSYSRIAYLREIHGDYQGAIDAMKRAVNAGAPGEESTEWCRVQLGKLYEAMGDLANANFQYQLSLATRPAFAHAYSGLGRLAAADKKMDSAIFYYEKADALINDITIKDNLAAALKLTGNKERSEAIYKSLIKEMNNGSKNAVDDGTAGHYADREMAYVYLNAGNLDKALEHALLEYNRRPKNIDVNETMAWVCFKKKEYAKALRFLDAAFVTESKSPSLLCIAGLVYLKNGNALKGQQMIETGLKNDPIIAEDIKNNCMSEMARK